MQSVTLRPASAISRMSRTDFLSMRAVLRSPFFIFSGSSFPRPPFSPSLGFLSSKIKTWSPLEGVLVTVVSRICFKNRGKAGGPEKLPCQVIDSVNH